VRFAAIAAVLVLGLAAAGVTSSKTSPKRVTATGKISVLKVKRITVHGKHKLTCRNARGHGFFLSRESWRRF
jgi:hypothetical protein